MYIYVFKRKHAHLLTKNTAHRSLTRTHPFVISTQTRPRFMSTKRIWFLTLFSNANTPSFKEGGQHRPALLEQNHPLL